MSPRRPAVLSSLALSLVVLSVVSLASVAHAGRPTSGGGGGGKGGMLLSGGNIIPGPGDPSGLVSGTVSFSKGQACFEFSVSSLVGQITHIGIYQGSAGANGPQIVVLNPMPPGIMGLRGCVPVDPAIARQISGNKAGYYVMITTTQYPDGAVRAQLGSR